MMAALAIIEGTGKTRRYVATVVSQYDGRGRDDDWEADARSGSERLIAAIRQHHPEMLL
jgi:hypothetical protein